MMDKRVQRELKPEPFVEYALARFARAGSLVLDLGCGPALYRHSNDAHYIGVDIIDSRLAAEPDGADVIAASNRLPFAESTFHLAFMKSALHLMPDPDMVLREMCRVLGPAGRILVFDYNRRTQRKLGALTSSRYPCWTQWELKERLSAAGFVGCQHRGAIGREVGFLEGLLRFPAQEWLGTWAIATGIKSE